jgi:hypothetical protein
MYTDYKESLNQLITNAAQFVLDNDRMLYRPFFEAAERFCIANDVLLGGPVGISLLCGTPLTIDSFFWDLYCDDTFVIAKALTVALSQVRSAHIPASTAAMQTNIKHKEFTISINARMLFKIYATDRYRGVKLITVMGPAVRTGYFTREPIKCIPEEMQLISVYRTLYSPARVDQWSSALTTERVLYGLVEDVMTGV